MLGNAAPTPYDLRFSLFGIPVRVHPMFWVFSAVMGWDRNDFNFMLLWIGCVFLSILVHELGHALTAQHFGWRPEIVLYAFGGYAGFMPTWNFSTRRSVLVSLAGPGAGFVLFGIVWGLERLIFHMGWLPDSPQQALYLIWVLQTLIFINLWWGLVNLLPVYPLDGGQVSRELLRHFRPYDGLEISLKLSILLGGCAAAFFLTHQQMFAGILFLSLTFESLQHLQMGRYR
ncbi:MAG: metalloprotease [Planctomycetales bacterium]